MIASKNNSSCSPSKPDYSASVALGKICFTSAIPMLDAEGSVPEHLTDLILGVLHYAESIGENSTDILASTRLHHQAEINPDAPLHDAF